MRNYLLGLGTLPALGLAYLVVVTLIDSWINRRITCGICGRARRGWALRQRIHARVSHGLAMTVKGRTRRRQWIGLTWSYAQRHGVTRDEYDAACDAARARFREMRIYD